MGLYLEINIALFIMIFILLFSVIEVIIYVLDKKCCSFILMCFMGIFISYCIVSNYELKYNAICNEINQENTFVGTITEVGKETKYYRTYTVKIDNINKASKYKNINILLRVKKSSNCKNLKYGNKVQGLGNFEKPSIRRNYKGFDYSKYLKTKSVYYICTNDGKNIKVVREKSICVYNMWINSLKNRIKSSLTEVLPSDSANISIALLLGDTAMLEQGQKQLFSDASLSHVLAISGMHVSYVILGVEFVLRKFDKRKGKYIYILILIFFAHFTGGSASVIRAVIMAIIAIISKLVYRKSDTLNNIAIAALIILISNPYNILNLGFQLSFLGTLGIVLFNSKISNILSFIKFKKFNSLLAVSISANIMIFPIIINVYNTVSFVFLVSNILVAPLLGVMCFVGYLTVFVSLISLKLARLLGIVLNIIMKIFSHIAHISGSMEILKFTVRTPSIVMIIVYYLLIFYVFFYYRKCHKKILLKLVSAITVIVLLFNVLYNNQSKLKIYFIDVGQGDCTVIVTPSKKTIIIDGGGSEGNDYDIGKNVLIPYLLDRGIISIDYMIFSHFDSDHAKGLLSVMENLEVRNAIISKQGKGSQNYNTFLEIAQKKKIKVIYIHLDDRIKIDKYTYFDFLWPSDNLISENVLNNNSIVCKLHYGKFTMLFTGDIEKIAEDEILNEYNESSSRLKSTVLKVGHHGSKTSSSMEFIDIVDPVVALIGVGEKNKFGHPNEDVIERFEKIR